MKGETVCSKEELVSTKDETVSSEEELVSTKDESVSRFWRWTT